MKFSQFLTEHITHIEDLSAADFVSTVTSLSQHIITEKLDGAALSFGIDCTGTLYTNRQQKGSSTPIYDSQEWGKSVAHVGFKAAHQALQQIEHQLASVLPVDVIIECEVLYGPQPNAIVYGSNYIAFLRAISEDSAHIIANLQKLKLDPVTVGITALNTSDGITLVETPTELTWQFVTPQQITTEHLATVDLHLEIVQLQSYLEQLIATPLGVMSVHEVAMSNSRSKELTQLRKQVCDHLLTQFKLPIKEKILTQVVRKLSSSLHSTSSDPCIEGIVLFDPLTDRQVKVVDKDVFSALNQFNFAIRNQVKSAIPRNVSDTLKVIETRSGSIYGDLLEDLSIVLNTPQLKSPRTIRTFLATPALSWPFAADAVAPKLIQALKTAEASLLQAKHTFDERVDSFELATASGKKFKYSPEIVRRTLSHFAQVITDVRANMQAVQSASTVPEIVEILYKSYLPAK